MERKNEDLVQSFIENIPTPTLKKKTRNIIYTPIEQLKKKHKGKK
jgi:hypothetical protein